MKFPSLSLFTAALWALPDPRAFAVAFAADDDATGIPDGGTEFKHFVAMNKTQTCVGDVHAMPFNNQIRGANLGGWMVLEPWITPSLFYQFLGGSEGTTAFDTYTFCEVLGAKKANKQLKNHWETWVTEDIIREMASSGSVNSLRLPVGDYMFKPYGPYGKFRRFAAEAIEVVKNDTCVSYSLLYSIQPPLFFI